MHPVFRKLFSTVLTVALLSLPATARSIIPQPLEMKMRAGRFILPKMMLYHFKKGCEKEAAYFQQKMENTFSIKTAVVHGRKKRQVSFDVDHNKISLFGTEGYKLIINSGGIHVSAAAPAGIFYAIQSILQLIEKDGQGYSLPLTEIFDKPRFSWRAFLMDEARSFKGVATVKKMLDEMAFLKMNVFHWHLTDDQGWRIQIPRYPKLTSASSGMITAVPGKTFYTHGDIRDIVEYAAERHILIVPEIEMPGHASAAIAAYPDLGVEKKPVTMPSVQGIFENIYDVSDTSVIQFIHDVINEVKTLFPSGIIHIGGDEVKYISWENSERVQAFMKQNKIASPAALQQWFVNGISRYIQAMGYRMMGWNDMLEKQHDTQQHTIPEGLAAETIIHFWLGSPELINSAARAGYDVVNSFHEYTYLDYSYKSISLEKAYSFNPVPPSLDTSLSKKILGLGCQMWGEHIPTVEKMYYQVFPRIAAYAEVGWTSHTNKDFKRFKNALPNIVAHWKANGILIDPATIQ